MASAADRPVDNADAKDSTQLHVVTEEEGGLPDRRSSEQPLVEADVESGPHLTPNGGGGGEDGPGGGANDGKADGDNGPAVNTSPRKDTRVGYLGIFRPWALLGWTAFGGPAAHIGQFHKLFVEEKSWMSEGMFAELLALCQCLPGPASTQMSFAMGVQQKGILGGLLSGILFQYPGLIMMSAVGFGAAKWLEDPAGWLKGFSAGLSAVAVSLVASAALSLGRKMCVDRVTTLLCAAAAVITYYYQSQWIFPTLIVVGGLVTIYTRRKQDVSLKAEEDKIDHLGLNVIGGIVLLSLWLVILIVVIIVRNNTSYESAKWIHWFEAFYITGSVTYGGGQVVLPILEQQVVQFDTVCTPATNATNSLTASNEICVQVLSPDTWVTEEQFLAGLAVAQAMPGPLFNFAAYLGAVFGGFPGILAAWLGLFGPGIMIIFGVLPFWGRFRKWAIYRRALPGLNSTAIGLVWSAVFTLGLKAYVSSPFRNASVCIGIIGYCATEFFKVPPPIAILAGGVLGIIAWATGMN